MGEGDSGYGGGYGDAGPGDTGGSFSGGFDGSAGDGWGGLGMGGWGSVGEGGWGDQGFPGFDPNMDFAMFDPNGYSWSDPGSSADAAAMYGPEGYGETGGWGEFNRQFLNPVRTFMKSPIGRVGQAALSIGVPGAAGVLGLANLGLGLTGDSPGQTVASTLGGIAGNAMGLPGVPGFGNLGGMIGSMAYNGINSGVAAPGSFGGAGGMGDALGTVGGLAALYGQQKRAGDMASNLGSMFGPNSAYAKQLEQSLSRRDAAAGRRSQYGPRSVELQARLAGMANQIAPNQMAAGNQQWMRQMQMLNLLGAGMRSGAFSGLGGLFSGMGGGGSSPAASWNDMFGGTTGIDGG